MIQNNNTVKNNSSHAGHVVRVIANSSEKTLDHKTFDEKYNNAPYWKPKKQLDLEKLFEKAGYSSF